MNKRGRPSAASLEVVTGPVEVVQRPKPPHLLGDEEAEVWHATVNGMPADWFNAASLPVLTQYCRHVVQTHRLAELIERETSGPAVDPARYDLLLRMQDRESKAVALMATKLRITPHSMTNHRGNKQKTIALRLPWERKPSAGRDRLD